jgi:hypothetical protein
MRAPPSLFLGILNGLLLTMLVVFIVALLLG